MNTSTGAQSQANEAIPTPPVANMPTAINPLDVPDGQAPMSGPPPTPPSGPNPLNGMQGMPTPPNPPASPPTDGTIGGPTPLTLPQTPLIVANAPILPTMSNNGTLGSPSPSFTGNPSLSGGNNGAMGAADQGNAFTFNGNAQQAPAPVQENVAPKKASTKPKISLPIIIVLGIVFIVIWGVFWAIIFGFVQR